MREIGASSCFPPVRLVHLSGKNLTHLLAVTCHLLAIVFGIYFWQFTSRPARSVVCRVLCVPDRPKRTPNFSLARFRPVRQPDR